MSDSPNPRMPDTAAAPHRPAWDHIDTMYNRDSDRGGDYTGTVPVFEFEFGYDETGLNNLLQVPQQAPASLKVKITRILCFIPAGASGLLTAGSLIVPVGPGTTNLSVHLQLQIEDQRLLQSTVNGTLMLCLMGEQLTDSMRRH